MKLTKETTLIVKREWSQPYHSFVVGDSATIEYWARIFGKSVQDIMEDLQKDGYLTVWFKIKEV